ncbi:MAG: hypothetical protein ACPG1A_17385, partial [Halioglobus sp.]
MALVYMQGWEMRPGQDSLARWNVSGVVQPNQTTVTFQHPDGYGGGDTALACSSGASLEAPSEISLVGTGQMQSCVQAGTTWQQGATILALIDGNGDDIIELRAADTSEESRIAVLHNGVTQDTTSQRLSVGEWYRITMRFYSGGTMLLGTYVDGQLVSDVQVTRMTQNTATGIRWGGASYTNLYHDHTTCWEGATSSPRSFDNFDSAALREVWIQGLRPSGDNTDGGFTPTTPGDLYPMLTYADDSNSCETTTDPDALQVQMENRSVVDPSWDPIIQGVQVQGAGRGHGTLDKAAVTMELSGTLVAGTTLTISGTHGM